MWHAPACILIKLTDNHCTHTYSVCRVCCCDDKGHAGCVVGLASESGEASGVDETHKQVNSSTAGRRPAESNTTSLSATVIVLNTLILSVRASLCQTKLGT